MIAAYQGKPGEGMTYGKLCGFCRSQLPTTVRRDSVFCSRKCRQAAFRLRCRRSSDVAADRVMRFAYADPPYPGFAKRYYGKEETYGGEVDHRELVDRLQSMALDGWALSTASRSLRDVLPFCPENAHVCAWVKPLNCSSRARGLQVMWEPLIVVGGREEVGGRRDWLVAQPARFWGTLTGRKPLAFCAFLFDALGMRRGDELLDLYPGTGMVSRAWAAASLGPGRDVSPLQSCDASFSTGSDASSGPSGDESSFADLRDASSRTAGDGRFAT